MTVIFNVFGLTVNFLFVPEWGVSWTQIFVSFDFWVKWRQIFFLSLLLLMRPCCRA